MPSDGITKETPETTKEQARPDTAAAKAQERAEKVDRNRAKENLPSRLRANWLMPPASTETAGGSFAFAGQRSLGNLSFSENS